MSIHRRVLFLCHNHKNHGAISFVTKNTSWKKDYLDTSAVRHKRTNQYTNVSEIRGSSVYDVVFLVNCPIGPIEGIDLSLNDNYYFVPLADITFDMIRLLKHRGLLIIPCFVNANILLEQVQYILRKWQKTIIKPAVLYDVSFLTRKKYIQQFPDLLLN